VSAPRPGLRLSRAKDPVAALAGSTVAVLDGPATKRELLDAIAAALAFPGWAGRNWDALADALGDLSWLPPGAYGLVWRHPRALPRADRVTALEVLGEAASASAGTDRPLTVLVVR
jgi:hypothetical protein